MRVIIYFLLASCSFQKIDESISQELYKQPTDTSIIPLVEISSSPDELHLEQTQKTATTTEDNNGVSPCNDLSLAYHYAWINEDTLSAYMSRTYVIDADGYMCYTKVENNRLVSSLETYDEIPSNIPNTGLMLTEFTDTNFVVGAYYSEENDIILYQKSVSDLGKSFYELWKIDLGTRQQEKITDETGVTPQFIYPDSIYWLSPTLVFIDSPIADYDDLLIDLENNQLEKPFTECILAPFTRLLFSPDSKQVLILVPDLTQANDSVFGLWNVYKLSTHDFLGNYSECKINKVEDIQVNRDTLLQNGEKMPFNIFSFDAISYYPPIFWDEIDQSIYYIDRDKSSDTYGDLVQYSIVYETKTQMLAYETYEEIMINRDNYLFMGMNSNNTKIFIETNNSTVFVEGLD